MSLAPGTRLGPYEVTARIGAGGMGEVYRATDTNLARQVAVKVLPDAVSHDAERLARFDREAKALAALNHPNIAQIYGLERSDGRVALVMELVEGPTLAERIASGPIPLDDALPIAKQIAEALEAAHEQGIIHRDLKPSNVKVREDGTVKVLDFGLAKAIEPTGPSGLAGDSMSPTVTSPAMTGRGVILGTAAYMSPEQARGKPVDRRADVWAFGVVLYEMLAGRRPFEGDDVTDLVAAVVRAEPDWSRIPVTTPGAIVRLLHRCLVKDRRNRLHHVGDARLELDAAVQEGIALPSPARVDRGRSAGLALLVVTILAVTGFAVVWARWPAHEPAETVAFTEPLPDGVEFRRTGRQVLAISRDGSEFVYNTSRGLYLRTLRDRQPRPIPGTEGQLVHPFLSPDGTEVGYWAPADQQLKRMPVNGGESVVICRATLPLGISWAADGTIVFGQREGIMRVPATGGTPEIVVTATEGHRLYGPQLLPDGDSVLFVEARPAEWDEGQIVAASMRTGSRTPLGLTGRDVRYVPTGHLVYAVEDHLFAVAFDAARLKPLASAVSLVQGVAGSGRTTGAAFFAVSDTGTLVYIPGETGPPLRSLVWVGRDGREEPIVAEGQPYQYPRISPDGTRVALSLEIEGDIFVQDLVRGVQQNLTSSDALEYGVLWTPKGDRLFFSSEREGVDARLYAISAEGGGDVERLAEGPPGRSQFPQAVTPDGSKLIFKEATYAGTDWDLRMVSLEAPRTAEALLVTEFAEQNAELSSDGRWMAYQSNRSGRNEVFVSPFPDVSSRREQASRGGGTRPLWARHGRELFYVRPGSATEPRMMMSVEVGTDLTLGTPRALFDVSSYHFGVVMSGRTFDMAADGRFLMIKNAPAPTDSPRAIEVVVNWIEALKARAPGR